jgi:uncharacterized membrane protein
MGENSIISSDQKSFNATKLFDSSVITFNATLLGISGWYGGELVYRHKIAVIGYGDSEQP